MDDASTGLLRALCFHDAWGYVPTRFELLSGYDHASCITHHVSAYGMTVARVYEALLELLRVGRILERRGRLFFPGNEAWVVEHEKLEALFSRKVARARRVAQWLARLNGVRFVALCNTTAWAHARDEGDLDFFVVAREGTIWQTRAWATLPFKLLRLRPEPGRVSPDAVCLSFFIDDASLDLSPLMLKPDDVYFRHWFLSLLPLYDDGVSEVLWNQNEAIRKQHPLARRWLVNPDLEVTAPSVRFPLFRLLEPWARKSQTFAFDAEIRRRMNQDSCVVVTDHVLKFHVEDGREAFRQRYQETCVRYGVE